MFLPEQALRRVDAAVAGQQVRDDRDDDDVRQHAAAEQLDRHDRERERRVRGGAEDRGEADAAAELDRQPEQTRRARCRASRRRRRAA